MNPRIKKELRSMLPSFAVTVPATIASALIFDGENAAGIVSFIFGGGCVMMGASSFGNEFYAKTMTSLLAQPISRRQIWREKLQILGGLLVVAYLVWMFSVSILVHSGSVFVKVNYGLHTQAFNELAFWTFLVPFIVYCSAPGISLLVTNIIGSMVSVVVIPTSVWLILMFVDWLISYLSSQKVIFLGRSFDDHPAIFVGTITLLYCLAAYVIGYRRFLKFESLDSRSQEVRLPVRMEKAIAPWVHRLIPGYTGPIASLIRKELELQRLSYLMAGMACLWLPIAAMIWEIHPSGVTTSMMIAPFVIFVVLTPLIVGSVSFAEERNLGMANWQFTLPPSARIQWHVKFLVTVVTGLGLGVVLPVILLFFAQFLFDMQVSKDLSSDLIFWIFFGLGYSLVFAVIMFASSISTNPIRAIIAAIGILTGAAALFALTDEFFPRLMRAYYGSKFFEFPSLGFHYNVQNITATIALMGCILLLMIYLMAAKNFQRGERNPRSASRQLAILFITVSVMIAVGQTLGFMLMFSAVNFK